MNDVKDAAEDVRDKAREQVTLDRWQLWTLRVGAAASVISAIAHIGQALHNLGSLIP